MFIKLCQKFALGTLFQASKTSFRGPENFSHLKLKTCMVWMVPSLSWKFQDFGVFYALANCGLKYRIRTYCMIACAVPSLFCASQPPLSHANIQIIKYYKTGRVWFPCQQSLLFFSSFALAIVRKRRLCPDPFNYLKWLRPWLWTNKPVLNQFFL